jgi:hypothetical protein
MQPVGSRNVQLECMLTSRFCWNVDVHCREDLNSMELSSFELSSEEQFRRNVRSDSNGEFHEVMPLGFGEGVANAGLSDI